MKGVYARIASSGPSEPEPDRDLAGALHEVSNALTVVLGWLERAESRLASGVAREAVEVARQHAELGYCVARRAIGAEVERECDRTALRVARDCVLAVKPEAQRRDLRVSVAQNDRHDILLQNALVAQQIVLNLLLNAIAFTPPGGSVTLSLHCEGDTAVFTVSDEGPGIPPERAENLFSGPDSTRRGGAGIGLCHSSALAAAGGGSLRLLHPGPGAKFELRWPAAEAKSGTQHNDVAVASLHQRRILVVEDDCAVMSLIELALEARGAVVVGASTIQELESSVAAHPPFDAALVDLSPLEGATESALQLMRADNPQLPLILISGLASGVPDEAHAHFSDWVRKPFTMDEIVASLTRTFDGQARRA